MSDAKTRIGLRVAVDADVTDLSLEGTKQTVFAFVPDEEPPDEATIHALAGSLGQAIQSMSAGLAADLDPDVAAVTVTLSPVVDDLAGADGVRDGIERADGEVTGSDVTIEFEDGLALSIEAGNEAAMLEENAGASRQ